MFSPRIFGFVIKIFGSGTIFVGLGTKTFGYRNKIFRTDTRQRYGDPRCEPCFGLLMTLLRWDMPMILHNQPWFDTIWPYFWYLVPFIIYQMPSFWHIFSCVPFHLPMILTQANMMRYHMTIILTHYIMGTIPYVHVFDTFSHEFPTRWPCFRHLVPYFWCDITGFCHLELWFRCHMTCYLITYDHGYDTMYPVFDTEWHL